MIYGFVSEVDDQPVTVVVAADRYEEFGLGIAKIKLKKVQYDENVESDPIWHLINPDFREYTQTLEVFIHSDEAQRDKFLSTFGIEIANHMTIGDRLIDMEQQKKNEEESALYQKAYENLDSRVRITMADMLGVDVDKISDTELNMGAVQNAREKLKDDTMMPESFESYTGKLHVVDGILDGESDEISTIKFTRTAAEASEKPEDKPEEAPKAFDPSAFASALNGETPTESPAEPPKEAPAKPAYDASAFASAFQNLGSEKHSEQHPRLVISGEVAEFEHEEQETLDMMLKDAVELMEEMGFEDATDDKIFVMEISKAKTVNQTFELLNTKDVDLDGDDSAEDVIEANPGVYFTYAGIGLSVIDEKEKSIVFHIDEDDAFHILYKTRNSELVQILIISIID